MTQVVHCIPDCSAKHNDSGILGNTHAIVDDISDNSLNSNFDNIQCIIYSRHG